MSLDSDDEDKFNKIKIDSESSHQMENEQQTPNYDDLAFNNKRSENKERQFLKIKSTFKSEPKKVEKSEVKVKLQPNPQNMDDQLQDFEDKTPVWALSENHMDKNRKK